VKSLFNKKAKKTGDQAVLDYLFAKEFGWTFDQIDNSDGERMMEMITVNNLYEKYRPKPKPVKRAGKKGKRPIRKRR